MYIFIGILREHQPQVCGHLKENQHQTQVLEPDSDWEQLLLVLSFHLIRAWVVSLINNTSGRC